MSATLAAIGLGIGKLVKGIRNRKEGGLIDQGIDAGLGMGLHKWKQNQQVQQSEKLQEQQIEGQKEMGMFNQGLAIDTWKATESPEAQANSMRKAGLNVGLMYSGAGGGGGATTQAGNVSGQQAYTGNDIGMALDYGLKTKQIENETKVAESQANLNNTQANKLAGVDTDIAWQGLRNLQKEEKLKDGQIVLQDLEATWKRIQNGYAERSNEENLKLLQTANKEALERYEILARQNKWDAETYNERARKITLENQMLGIRMEAEKAGIKLTEAQTQATYKTIERMQAEMDNWDEQRQQEWLHLSIQERQARATKMFAEAAMKQAEFNTGTMAEIQRGAEIAGTVIGAIGSATKMGGGAAPIKGFGR